MMGCMGARMAEQEVPQNGMAQMRASERGAAAAFSGRNGRPQALRRPMRFGQTPILTASPAVRRGLQGSRLRAGGLEPRRLFEVGVGPLVVALGTVCEAPLVVGVGKLGIELDRLVEVGDGAVVVSLGTGSHAPVVIGPEGLRFEPDRLAAVGVGAVVVALGGEGYAPAGVG